MACERDTPPARVGSDQRPDLEQLCPEVVIEGDTVCIGEDATTAVLKKDEWNILVGWLDWSVVRH